MSGHKIRTDPTCLNCGRFVEENYCTHCGQENIQPRQPFHYLFTHFFEDLTHYDGKFWQTIRYLLFSPAKLTTIYLNGKRQSFVPPVRLYIFLSFVAFLLPALLSYKNESPKEEVKQESVQEQIEKIEAGKRAFAEGAKKSHGVITAQDVADFNAEEDDNIAELKRKSTESKNKDEGIWFLGNNKLNNIKTIAQFDSLQKVLPKNEKYNWYKYKIIKKELELKEGGMSRKGFKDKLKESIVHNLPKALFLYMPLFAFWLWLFHSKKKWLYFDHGIFTLHYFSFLLAIISIYYIIAFITGLFGESAFIEKLQNFVFLGGLVWGFFYFFRSHSRFYKERKSISRLKGFCLFFINIAFMIAFLILLGAITFLNLH